MNKQHINQILNISSINIHQQYHTDRLRHFQYFDPYTSECYHFDLHIVPNNNHYDLHVCNVKELIDSCDWHMHHQNYIKHFRSFILASLIGGMKRYNDATLIPCVSKLAAYRYSNPDGIIVCIKNSKGANQWGVIK